MRRTIASDPPQTLPVTLTDLDQLTITERGRAQQVARLRNGFADGDTRAVCRERERERERSAAGGLPAR